MATAQGPGKKIDGGGLAVPSYSRIYAYVKPLLVDATGAPLANPGRVDANGQYLHFRYSGNLDLGARSGGNQIPGGVKPLDFVENKIVVEFDAQSEFTLPFEGFLELVGGLGEYAFGMFVHDRIDKQFYQPELRILSTYKVAGSTFTIPDFHTYILGSNSGSQYVLPTGDVLEPGVILPGTTITTGIQITTLRNSSIKTGWRG